MSTPHNPNNGMPEDGGPLLNQRAALIILLALVVAATVCALTLYGGRSVSEALLAALFAFGGAVLFGMKIIR
ncbi:MAG TPA: hypothetical protein VNO31_32370 [Umezawaea sp.]|nr:hypothetical protein [Umezawaea sp.]